MRRNSITYLNYWIKSKNRKPLILRGARQVGKSTLVRLFAAEADLELVEINLERHTYLDKTFATLDVEKILTEIQGILSTSIPPKNALLFLDEIQATPHALAALRYFYEDRPHLPVIAAGSLLEFLLSEADFSMPVGRIQYLHLGPLSFEEFLQARGDDWILKKCSTYRVGGIWSTAEHQKMVRYLREFLFVGGMPEAAAAFFSHQETFAEAKSSQQRIVDTYKDDFSKYRKRSTWIPVLQSIYSRLPAFIGRKMKYAEILPEERIEKIHGSINLLSDARVIHKAFHSKSETIPLAAGKADRVFKIYWIDVGLLNRLLGLDPELSRLDSKLIHEGPLAEQFVAQHLAFFHGEEESPALFYWLREGKADNAEVDFLIQLGQYVIPVEVKAGKTGALRSLQQYVLSRQPKLAVKLCMEPPSLNKFSVKNPAGDTVTCLLLTLPIYLTPWLKEIASDVLKGA